MRSKLTFPLSQNHAKIYNQIDKEMHDIKLNAAKNCRIKQTGGKQWSDKLQQARDVINVWWLVT